MRTLLATLTLLFALPTFADDPTQFLGFANGKSKYYILTEIPGSETGVTLDSHKTVIRLLIHYEYKKGSAYRISNYDSEKPSNCSALKSKAGEWLRVKCEPASDSPLNDISYSIDYVASKKNGATVLRCVRGCRSGIPASMLRNIPGDTVDGNHD
jgi:hypothetical protein